MICIDNFEKSGAGGVNAVEVDEMVPSIEDDQLYMVGHDSTQHATTGRETPTTAPKRLICNRTWPSQGQNRTICERTEHDFYVNRVSEPPGDKEAAHRRGIERYTI